MRMPSANKWRGVSKTRSILRATNQYQNVAICKYGLQSTLCAPLFELDIKITLTEISIVENKRAGGKIRVLSSHKLVVEPRIIASLVMNNKSLLGPQHSCCRHNTELQQYISQQQTAYSCSSEQRYAVSVLEYVFFLTILLLKSNQ